MTAKTFRHQTSTGVVATRKSESEYTHVLVGVSRHANIGVEVISWHKTETAAAAAGRRYSHPRASRLNVAVEPINGGVR
jgi:hypothetical protein